MKINFNRKDLNNITDRLNELNGVVVKVGVPSGPREKIAIANEYGTQKIPSRPFIRPILYDEKHLNDATRETVKGWIKKEGTVGKNLSDALVYKIRKYISDAKEGVSWKGNTMKKLAPSTIKKKGHDKILVETTDLFHSVEGEVVNKGGKNKKK